MDKSIEKKGSWKILESGIGKFWNWMGPAIPKFPNFPIPKSLI